ncbi:MAG: DUF2066 domain-containing protein [Pseudomonadota bacterium]
MIRYFLTILAFTTGLSASDGVASASLYAGELPVQTEQGQAVPLAAVLNQVLVRLTGRVGQNLVSSLGLNEAEIRSMILTQEYRQLEVPNEQGGATSMRLQRIEFDQLAINQLLDHAGWPRWGQERPALLLWVVSDDAGGADYVTDDPVVNAALEQASFRYGLNLIQPILDAGDRIEVSPSDIRGGFTDASAAAMARYGASGVVMLDLRDNQNYLTGRWSWSLNNLDRAFERSGADEFEVVDLGLGRIAAAMASRFAVRAGQTDRQRLVISGISSELHYAEIVRYLNTLTGVRSLQVLRLEGEQVVFEIDSSGTGLDTRIALSDLLDLERRDPTTRTLYYRLTL